MRRVVPLVVLGFLFSLASLGPASAGDEPSGPTTTLGPEVPSGEIIPKPNSGAEPESADDRGGANQTLVFVLMLAGLGTIGVLAWRSSIRARRR